MEQSKIWDYYQSYDIESFDGSYSRLNFLIKKCKNKKVLNIGVGGGIFEKLALKNNVDIYSLDPSEKAINNLKKIIGNKKAKVGYSQMIPFENNFFDVIVMSEVLEHLDEGVLYKSLNEINRVLKNKGKFIGTVPYKENLKEQIVVCPNCGEKFHKWGHVQSFDEFNLNKLLSKYFSKTIVKKKNFLYLQSLNWKGKIFALIHYLFYILNIKQSGLNLYFEAEK